MNNGAYTETNIVGHTTSFFVYSPTIREYSPSIIVQGSSKYVIRGILRGIYVPYQPISTVFPLIGGTDFPAGTSSSMEFKIFQTGCTNNVSRGALTINYRAWNA